MVLTYVIIWALRLLLLVDSSPLLPATAMLGVIY